MDTRVTIAIEIIILLLKLIWDAVAAVCATLVPPREKTIYGKTVLVTGTASGIGRELAKQYGRLGATVLCIDVNTQANEKTVAHIKQQGIHAHAFTCNIAVRTEVEELAEKIQTEIGKVDILVNNAGVLYNRSFLHQTPEQIMRTFNVNVISNFWILQAFLPAMIERGRGHVVAISSAAGLEGIGNATAYSATKFAVRGLMESLERESKENRWGIRTTTVYPFYVNTGLCIKEMQKTRFRSILRELTTEQVAATTIAAQRRGTSHLSLPNFMLPGTALYSIIPQASVSAIKDFLGAGMKPQEAYRPGEKQK